MDEEREQKREESLAKVRETLGPDVERALREGDLEALFAGLRRGAGPEWEESARQLLGTIQDFDTGAQVAYFLRLQVPDQAEKLLTGLLRDPASPPGARLGAVVGLRHIDAASSEAIGAFAAAIEDEDEKVVQEARTALWLAGRRNVEVLAVVAAVLEGSPSPTTRAHAAWILGRTHPRDEDRGGLEVARRAEALRRALGDTEPTVRLEALEAVRFLDPRERQLATAARECLRDPEDSVRSQAAETLRWAGDCSREENAALVQALKDPSLGVRVRAASALCLRSIEDQAIPPIVAEALHGEVTELRELALEMTSLGARAEDFELQPLLAALKDPAPGPRRQAVIGILNVAANEPEKARLAVPEIVEALGDPVVRYTAARALREIDAGHPALVPALTEMLRGPRHESQEAAGLLLEIGAEREAAVRVLLPVLKDARHRREDLDVSTERDGALRTLLQAGDPDAEILAELKPLLCDPDPLIRAGVAALVLAAEPGNVDALDRVSAAMADDRAAVRVACARYLGRVERAAPFGVPLLIRALADPILRVCAAAAWSLSMLELDGAMAEKAVPGLRALLVAGGIEDGIAYSALEALRSIALRAGGAIPAIAAGLGNQDRHVRRHVAGCLQDLGRDAARAAPVLIAALGDPDLDVRHASLIALAKVAPGEAAAVESVIALLGEEDRNLLAWALAYLAGLGEQAAAAVPAIERLASYNDQELIGRARAALQAIRPPARGGAPDEGVT